MPSKLLDDPRYAKKGGVLHDHVLVHDEDIEIEVASQDDLAHVVCKIIEANAYGISIDPSEMKSPRPTNQLTIRTLRTQCQLKKHIALSIGGIG